MSPPSRLSPRAFTLIELLSVIVIVGVLAAIVITTVGRVREAARNSRCLSNLRQLHAAIMLHAADNRDVLVAADTGSNPPAGTPLRIRWYQEVLPSSSGHESPLAPYVGGGATLTMISVCPENAEVMKTASDAWGQAVKNYNGYPYTVNYAVIIDADRVADRQFVRRTQFINPARTILMTDSNRDQAWGGAGWEGRRANGAIPGNQNRIGEPHRGRTNALWLDGHVSTLTRLDTIERINSVVIQ